MLTPDETRLLFPGFRRDSSLLQGNALILTSRGLYIRGQHCGPVLLRWLPGLTSWFALVTYADTWWDVEGKPPQQEYSRGLLCSGFHIDLEAIGREVHDPSLPRRRHCI